MKERLNQNKIDYVLFHLQHHFEVESFTNFLCFEDVPKKNNGPLIVFPLSDQPIAKTFFIEETAVLFPISDEKVFYTFDTNGNLIFKHDLLKSAFYLLSGYQEFLPYKGDHLGRFTYSESIQKELNIAANPLVNVYFEIIINAVHEFCERHKISFKKKSFWPENKFGLLLTHDVDRVDKWTFMEIKRRLKMLIRSGFTKYWSYLLEALSKFKSGENPYWNFDWMKSLEKRLGFNSIWFFLPQGHKQIDAYYSFDEPRIQKLARLFQKNGDEIALHGTFNSRDNKGIMQENLDQVKELSGAEILASRQHWLSFKYPETLQILEKLDVKYDSSWGFAESYGWRNSYCLPFHPYDLENDRMMNIWELPLNAMDVSFFQYLGLSNQQVQNAFKEMIATCKKYNGLFVLLWHNSFFDETIYPGLTKLYEEILQDIKGSDPFSVLPANIFLN
ncbi:MAG: hypothetical protein D8M58_08155 [Calditrichaeota bacterium]|nr:MAG: hypothetical protein DWQ03_18335 [Calditrichota bacterium]MBL1205355.1 hypothetical protein [Calditrichota bacterium]NOG45184.1 hypothetical protein [Calditrichota bacterium]